MAAECNKSPFVLTVDSCGGLKQQTKVFGVNCGARSVNPLKVFALKLGVVEQQLHHLYLTHHHTAHSRITVLRTHRLLK